MGFLRQEYRSGLQFPSPGDLPNPRIEPMSPTLPELAGRFFTIEPPGKLAIPLLGIFPEEKKILIWEDIWTPTQGFPGGSVVKKLPANTWDTKDMGLIPGSGRSSGEGNVNPLQYSCLENSMDREALWATIHGVANNQPLLSMHACTSTPMLVEALFTIAKT